MDHNKRIQQMLGGRTPAEFAKLPVEMRNRVYQRYFVKKNGYVQIEEGNPNNSFNPEIAHGVMLRQEYYMGNDEIGKQLVKEARDVYYAENAFTIQSHLLCKFIRDALADGKPEAIESLVRKIMVTVDVEHIHDLDNFAWVPQGETEKSWVVRDLRQLLEFTNAKWIGIEVQSEGALNGSDLKTQQKIKEMSGVVKKLIDQFGNAFTILKIAQRRSNGYLTCHNLRPYWNKPTVAAKERLRLGLQTFEELMQIQIEEWT